LYLKGRRLRLWYPEAMPFLLIGVMTTYKKRGGVGEL
jgi:hypothetical protein